MIGSCEKHIFMQRKMIVVFIAERSQWGLGHVSGAYALGWYSERFSCI